MAAVRGSNTARTEAVLWVGIMDTLKASRQRGTANTDHGTAMMRLKRRHSGDAIVPFWRRKRITGAARRGLRCTGLGGARRAFAWRHGRCHG